MDLVEASVETYSSEKLVALRTLLTGRTNNDNGLEAGIYETSMHLPLCALWFKNRPSESHANEVISEF